MRPTRALLLVLAVVGLALAAVTLVASVHLDAINERRAAATSVVTAVVVEDSIGDSDRVRVRWKTREGEQHEAMLDVYSIDRYRVGAPMEIRFDPSAPETAVWPTDPAETAQEDDVEGPLGLTVLAGMAALLFLVGRFLRAVPPRFGRWSTEEVRLLATTGSSGVVRGVWAVGSATQRPAQRVHWAPALDLLGSANTVEVSRRAGRCAVRLADGTVLMPLGRPRRAPRGTPVPLETVRMVLADSVTPADGRPSSARAVISRYAASGALLGGALGALDGNLTLVLLGLLVGAACGVVGWAHRGAVPW